MRAIKFRGKRIDNGEWVEGYYLKNSNHEFRHEIHLSEPINLGDGAFIISYEIDPTTIGQFTGLTDKIGKEVYQYHIVKTSFGLGVIMWFQTAWGLASYAMGYSGLKSYTSVDSFYTKEVQEWEVIGNIFDNPELLK